MGVRWKGSDSGKHYVMCLTLLSTVSWQWHGWVLGRYTLPDKTSLVRDYKGTAPPDRLWEGRKKEFICLAFCQLHSPLAKVNPWGGNQALNSRLQPDSFSSPLEAKPIALWCDFSSKFRSSKKIQNSGCTCLCRHRHWERDLFRQAKRSSWSQVTAQGPWDHTTKRIWGGT